MKNHTIFMCAAMAVASTQAMSETYSKIDFPIPGLSAAGASYGPKIDDFGVNVVFGSTKRGLVTGDTSTFANVFVKNLRTNVTTLLSKAPNGSVANNTSFAGYGELAISGDGLTVAFVSSATNLTGSADGNAYQDCFFVKLNPPVGPLSVVRIAPQNVVPNLSCRHVSINFDGSKIAFASDATNLGYATTTTNVFQYDVPSGTVSLLSAPGAPIANGSYSHYPSINSFGDSVVWQAKSVSDPVGYPHIFLRNGIGITRVDTALASACNAAQTQCGDAFGNGGSSYPAISDAGVVTWQSGSKAMVANDPNGNGLDVFKRMLPFGTEAVAQSTAYGPSFEPSIAATTSEVVFVTYWNGFFSPDNNQSFDLFLKNASYNLISKSAGGGVSNSGIRRHDISRDAQFIAFDQNGGNYPGTTTSNIGTSIVVLDRLNSVNHNLEVKINNGAICTTSLCSVTVKNLGPNDAANVTLTLSDTLGALTVQAPLQSPAWTCQANTAKVCKRASLLANETATFWLQNTVSSASTIRADFAADRMDSDFANNTAVATLPAN
jgi:hypothetical protein